MTAPLIYYEDGNSAHGLGAANNTNSARRAKELWNVNYIAAPPTSPDFNIIENVWRMIKSRIKTYEHAITNLADLKKAVLHEWEQITIEDIRKLVRTMPVRMQQARHRHGFATAF